MLIYLINPRNTMTSLVNTKEGFANSIRIWKPLGLLVLAGLTPDEWEIKIIDENLGTPDYDQIKKPDIVGITAFTSQAPRAYKIASIYRRMGIKVVMGGIHASMKPEEALNWVDSVVVGEAEIVWKDVLEDFIHHRLKSAYSGEMVPLEKIPDIPHHLLSKGYLFGSIQTTRGCPLNCSFCSVSAFNGNKYRHRPINSVVRELGSIKEKFVLIVDDNLIGTSKKHYARTKHLLQAIIDSKIKKKFLAQVTLNMADDEELLDLAAKAGLFGIFIGFESPHTEGLLEVKKKFNIRQKQVIQKAIRKIQKKGILVLGSFIMGLDSDKKGIGTAIANAGIEYGIDALNLMFLTPLPGTKLWEKFESENRIVPKNMPEDWKYFTLALPVANYMHLSWDDLFMEMKQCFRSFYSFPKIFRRFLRTLVINRNPFLSFIILLSNFNYKRSLVLDMRLFKSLELLKEGITYIENLATLKTSFIPIRN
ncbi:MAG: B12-binding domain-containing radical SAM protein [Spirochaetales bacterium]|nr:B12-binding domain-containing radical SAM protein [Spirochaetales bacterium]